MRTYSGASLTEAQKLEINRSIQAARSPFGGYVSISLVTFGHDAPERPGTYGIIKNCHDFLVMTARTDDESSLLSAGFLMEQVVLHATGMGLGTCWMAASFRSSSFKVRIPEGEDIVIVSPVGEPAERKSLIDRVTHALARSSTRKPFDQLFSVDAHSPHAALFREALEAVRLAPSSVNSQPWRAFCKGDRVHFYYKGSSRNTLIDMGIGLCHFYLICKAGALDGEFIKDPGAEKKSGFNYLCSFIVREL